MRCLAEVSSPNNDLARTIKGGLVEKQPTGNLSIRDILTPRLMLVQHDIVPSAYRAPHK
jgi:hypothetical protein